MTRAQLISRSLRANTLKKIEEKVNPIVYLRESLKRDLKELEQLKNKKIE